MKQALARPLPPWVVVSAGTGLALAGCGGKGPTAVAKPAPVATIGIGECAASDRQGAVSEQPTLVRADRDLGGGPELERVVADRAICDALGNCHWNVFLTPQGDDPCLRFAGTLSASVLEPLASTGPAGMRDVRAYWMLASGRMLVQEYRFSRGGYRVVDALLCRTTDDDRLECAEQAP